MNELHVQVLKSLTEMMQIGGGYALWGIIIYLVLNLLKISLVMGFSLMAIKIVLSTINNIWQLCLASKERKITLMSQEVSKQLSDSLAGIMTCLEKLEKQEYQLQDNCKKKSENLKE